MKMTLKPDLSVVGLKAFSKVGNYLSCEANSKHRRLAARVFSARVAELTVATASLLVQVASSAGSSAALMVTCRSRVEDGRGLHILDVDTNT